MEETGEAAATERNRSSSRTAGSGGTNSIPDLTRDELLGRVASVHLRRRLGRRGPMAAVSGGFDATWEPMTMGGAPTADSARPGQSPEGTARFIIDCLTAAQTAAIARAILKDSELAAQVDIRLPASLVGGAGLPADVLTNERATYFRNAPCLKPALLLANTGDDEEQSLREVTPIGAPDLLADSELWVQVAGAGLAITEDEQRWWAQALRGLSELQLASLDGFADYVLRTRAMIASEGHLVLDALDAALPALRLPRNAGEFRRLKPRALLQAAKWRAQYHTVHTKRACYLSKQTPTGGVLSEDELRATFERAKDSIPESCHSIVRDFLGAPGGWTDASHRLAQCDWEDIKPLFDGLKREKFNLGRATLDFYGEHDPEWLMEAEREYLVRLSMRRTTEAALDDDRDFYDAHRDEMREDRKLKSAWDRFIFGSPKETYDFLAGLATALEGLNWETPGTRRTLTVSCDSRFRSDFRELNYEVGLYFALRYCGLARLFGQDVVWQVGDLFSFPEVVEAWRQRGQTLNRSEAKGALQLKFVVGLEVVTARGGKDRSAAQFIWRYSPQCIAGELVNDWVRLAAHPLVSCSADREPTSSKGASQSVDLWNVRTLMAAHGQDRGSLVAAYRSSNNLARSWRDNLAEAQTKGLVSTEAAQQLNQLFERFIQTYTAAIQRFAADGLASAELQRQSTDYASLLEALWLEARVDRTRQLLLRPLLEVGAVAVKGGRATAIIAPWHPLRLAAMARKAQRVADLVHYLCTTPQVDFGDPRLFFHELREELAHPHYPEIALGWQCDQPELLALTDTAGDYSLHESPLAVDTGADDTNDNPIEGANRVADLVHRYLALHPHEQANLSVVLYNCDSSRLPLAVVDKLGGMQQDDDDVRCHVVLRHRDSKQLTRLYEQIVDASDGDSDAFVASETTRDFMARLRIGISADQAPVPDPRDGCPEDIVFSQDVIARHARLEWYLVDARPIDPADLNPAQWSRRRPVATGDMKSVVYLCCPVQSAQGWAYVTAISSFFHDDRDSNRECRLLPARQLDFRDAMTSRIFEETHNLGTWVVNYDELLDRRQLLEQGVRIIRYKQTNTQGRNLIISSRAPTSLLRSMVMGRLRDLRLDLDDSELEVLAERFISDANDVSGDIVLRAAQRGQSASELMGVVLSRYIIGNELGLAHHAGWYFLDDYADWLGQQEERIADLLALRPTVAPDGSKRLAVVVSEAKYIDAASLAAKRKESAKQLRDTLRRVAGAVVEPQGRLDREIWLARLSDLLVEGVVGHASVALDLPAWRRAIRDGRCAISLRGYSHVFISGPLDGSDYSARSRLSGYDAYQEVFGRSLVRELVLCYYRGEDPTSIRIRVDGEDWHYIDFLDDPQAQSATSTDGRGDEPRDSAGQVETSVSSADTDLLCRPNETETATGPVPPSVDSSGLFRLLPSQWETQNLPADNQAPKVESPGTQLGWPYPGVVDWLRQASDNMSENTADLAWLRQVEGTVKTALHQFQLQAKLIRTVLTPNAALLKFQGSENLTVDQVLRRRSEFLTTYGIQLIGVQPEPGVVSLSIARPHRELVSLRSLWQRWSPSGVNGNSSLLVGVREDDGELLVLSPGGQHAPHTLIAGSTGSGKSVLMQNIILSIAATNRPDQARITLVDPKQGVDYFALEDLPHLEGGIIDQQEAALTRIRALVEQMDARYVLMRRARAANLWQYNERVEARDRFPTLWLIHDEFAEWMLTDEYKQEVASAVQRLGIKARAAGIHLVFAAQRPEANVMPMQLRANLGNRLILRVDSEGTSEIALGDKGAERLLGKGHLLARLEGLQSMVYAQVPFATSQEIDQLVARIRSGAE